MSPDLNDPMVACRDFSDDDESMSEGEQRAIRNVEDAFNQQDLRDEEQPDPSLRRVAEQAAWQTAADAFKEIEKREASDLDCFLPGTPDDGQAIEAEAKINAQHQALADEREGFTIEELTEDDDEEEEAVDTDEYEYVESDQLSADLKAAAEKIVELEDKIDGMLDDEVAPLDEDDEL